LLNGLVYKAPIKQGGVGTFHTNNNPTSGTPAKNLPKNTFLPKGNGTNQPGPPTGLQQAATVVLTAPRNKPAPPQILKGECTKGFHIHGDIDIVR
jgi:hypothetical protein